jgi:hypothetical protein
MRESSFDDSAMTRFARLRRREWIPAFAGMTWATVLTFLLVATLPVHAAPVDDPAAADPALRRFTESMHGDAYALDVGRIAYRRRYDTALDDILYLVAPRGTWDATSPAWAPARAALAEAIASRARPRYGEYLPAARRLMNQASLRALTPDERAAVTAFFESPEGRAFMDARARSAAKDAFGVPPGPDAEPLARLQAESKAMLDGLDTLPPAQAKALDDFLESPLWKKVLHLQLVEWADTTSFFLNEVTQEVVREELPALASAVRTAVPGVPPPTNKTYLGTVAMASDGHFDVVVEHFAGLNRVGHYTLRFAKDAPQWRDIAAMAPGIHPGDTRYLFFDAGGRVGDRP